ncbi:TPA: hypothetical protein N0F65_007956 [Lagenidium giganteum]|uniref:Uncharacterized protein n=1 Tax=Lagenidium giganteum TaxID=4803 RepID=A0AAV2YF01_9STRA|nr:TPA: hypothetical protein N0F65_007956 [Lagenidium giganteum]
MAPQTSRL